MRSPLPPLQCQRAPRQCPLSLSRSLWHLTVYKLQLNCVHTFAANACFVLVLTDHSLALALAHMRSHVSYCFLTFPLLSLSLSLSPLMSSSKGWKTDTSGEYFPGNLAAPYTSFSGQLCQFGGKLESRVYHICDRDAATPAASVVYESFYDCQVFVELRSQVACEG